MWSCSWNKICNFGLPNLTFPSPLMSLVFFTGRRRRKKNAIETFQAESLHDESVSANDPARQLANACATLFLSPKRMTIQEATMEIKCMLQFFFDQPSSSRGISPGETCKSSYDRWTLVLFVSLGINSAPSVLSDQRQSFNHWSTYP